MSASDADVFLAGAQHCLWDPRVAEALASRMEERFETKMMYSESIGKVWLPNNFPKLKHIDIQRLTRVRTGNAIIDGNTAHNIRVLTGESDVAPEAGVLTDPRVLPNDTYTRDDVISLAREFHVPRLADWLGERLNCDVAIELRESPNVLTLIHLAIQNGPTTCAFLRSVNQSLLIFAAVPEEQWSDHPSDPCDVKQAFPWFLAGGQCLAVCDYKTGKQCARMAVQNQTFCKWHEAVQVTMHVRSTKRSARDILPDEYNNRSLNLETYSQTKRFVSGMTFAANPSAKPNVGFYLPVLRYEGLYHRYDPSYCGKFYFYEPESHLHLYLGNSRCFGSKVHAFIELSMARWPNTPPRYEMVSRVEGYVLALHKMRSMGFNSFPKTELRYILDIILKSNHVKSSGIGSCDTLKLSKNPTAFWDEFILSRYWSVYLSQDDLPPFVEGLPVMFPTDNPRNIAVAIGEFDSLDQPICELARELHIDTIIFQREIGSHDCVTEILDTRVEYKQHLYDLGPMVQMTHVHRYPKIWFPRDDSLVYLGPNAPRAEISSHVTELFPNLFPPTPFH